MKACSGMDTNLWFPSAAYDTNCRAKKSKQVLGLQPDQLEARRICFTCEERVNCLADNVLVEFGITGGRTTYERTQLRVAMAADGLIRLTSWKNSVDYDDIRPGWIPPTALQRSYTVECSEEEMVEWLYENEATALEGKAAA